MSRLQTTEGLSGSPSTLNNPFSLLFQNRGIYGGGSNTAQQLSNIVGSLTQLANAVVENQSVKARNEINNNEQLFNSQVAEIIRSVNVLDPENNPEDITRLGALASTAQELAESYSNSPFATRAAEFASSISNRNKQAQPKNYAEDLLKASITREFANIQGRLDVSQAEFVAQNPILSNLSYEEIVDQVVTMVDRAYDGFNPSDVINNVDSLDEDRKNLLITNYDTFRQDMINNLVSKFVATKATEERNEAEALRIQAIQDDGSRFIYGNEITTDLSRVADRQVFVNSALNTVNALGEDSSLIDLGNAHKRLEDLVRLGLVDRSDPQYQRVFNKLNNAFLARDYYIAYNGVSNIQSELLSELNSNRLTIDEFKTSLVTEISRKLSEHYQIPIDSILEMDFNDQKFATLSNPEIENLFRFQQSVQQMLNSSLPDTPTLPPITNNSSLRKAASVINAGDQTQAMLLGRQLSIRATGEALANTLLDNMNTIGETTYYLQEDINTVLMSYGFLFSESPGSENKFNEILNDENVSLVNKARLIYFYDWMTDRQNNSEGGGLTLDQPALQQLSTVISNAETNLNTFRQTFVDDLGSDIASEGYRRSARSIAAAMFERKESKKLLLNVFGHRQGREYSPVRNTDNIMISNSLLDVLMVTATPRQLQQIQDGNLEVVPQITQALTDVGLTIMLDATSDPDVFIMRPVPRDTTPRTGIINRFNVDTLISGLVSDNKLGLKHLNRQFTVRSEGVDYQVVNPNPDGQVTFWDILTDSFNDTGATVKRDSLRTAYYDGKLTFTYENNQLYADFSVAAGTRKKFPIMVNIEPVNTEDNVAVITSVPILDLFDREDFDGTRANITSIMLEDYNNSRREAWQKQQNEIQPPLIPGLSANYSYAFPASFKPATKLSVDLDSILPPTEKQRRTNIRQTPIIPTGDIGSRRFMP